MCGPFHERSTVDDIRARKGKRRLTKLYVETPDEAAAAAEAGIGMLSIIDRVWTPGMRAAEHLRCFSTIFYRLLIPSNPVVALYQTNFAGLGAFVGHIGFQGIEMGEDRGFGTHARIHYLHHKYFEVNYCDGLVPIDSCCGTFHDGSKEVHERMKERFRQKTARVRAASGQVGARHYEGSSGRIHWISERP